MPLSANAVATYGVTLIREDLQEAFAMISPEETPFLHMLKTRNVTATNFDWPTADLAAPDSANRVLEGENAPANDPATVGVRWTNVTQISDKTVEVTHTSQKADAAAGNLQTLDKQRVLKMKELRRDMEVMLLANVTAVQGAAATVRQTAGMQAWIRTNASRLTGGVGPVFSGPGGIGGRPSTAAVSATTPAVLTEARLNDVIQNCWNAGAEPSVIMVNGTNKRRISQAFTGNSTRYKDSIDKQLVSAIDFYDSDFGELSIVPNRFQPAQNAPINTSWSVLVLDPEYLTIAYLDTVQSKPLAETGHAIRELIWCEYGLQVDNEAAHGSVNDTNNAL